MWRILDLMFSRVRLIIMVAVMAYPFMVYFGMRYFSPRYIAIIIIGLLFIRMMLYQRNVSYLSKMLFVGLTVVGMVIMLVGAWLDNVLFIKLYPVMMSLLMFFAFLYSWLYPPTLLERFMPLEASYARKLTMVWCAFFLLNGLVALWTVLWAGMHIWALYNGLLSYLAMGLLWILEYAYRKWILSRRPV